MAGRLIEPRLEEHGTEKIFFNLSEPRNPVRHEPGSWR